VSGRDTPGEEPEVAPIDDAVVAPPPAPATRGPVLPPAVGATIVALVVITDVITKRMALASLPPRNVPHEVFGEYVRFTLAFNPGVAFGFHLGDASRWVFSALTVVILGVLVQLYRAAEPADRLRRVAIALVAGGAIGNLIDRLRWQTGVVDFIDIGIGDIRFWTFNVADMAVSTGAVVLIWVLQREDEKIRRAAAAAQTARDTVTPVRESGASE
jgi:signal peptidase II